MSELLQPMVNYYSNKLKQLSFFDSFYQFLPPIELIVTRVFSVFELVLSRVSNVMNIINWTAISISMESSNIFKIRLFSTNADFICDNHIQLTQLFTSSGFLAQSCTKDFMPV